VLGPGAVHFIQRSVEDDLSGSIGSHHSAHSPMHEDGCHSTRKGAMVSSAEGPCKGGKQVGSPHQSGNGMS
jgi:hypothetical protein